MSSDLALEGPQLDFPWILFTGRSQNPLKFQCESISPLDRSGDIWEVHVRWQCCCRRCWRLPSAPGVLVVHPLPSTCSPPFHLAPPGSDCAPSLLYFAYGGLDSGWLGRKLSFSHSRVPTNEVIKGDNINLTVTGRGCQSQEKCL